MWTRARMTTYLTGFFGGTGLLLAGFGLADFDHATGQIDIAPFNIYALAAAIPAIVAPALAFFAVKLGWGRK